MAPPSGARSALLALMLAPPRASAVALLAGARCALFALTLAPPRASAVRDSFDVAIALDDTSFDVDTALDDTAFDVDTALHDSGRVALDVEPQGVPPHARSLLAVSQELEADGVLAVSQQLETFEEFEIHLINPSHWGVGKRDLGVEVLHDAERTECEVTWVGDLGLIPAFNSDNVTHEVRVGDAIASANGATGNSTAIFEELTRFIEQQWPMTTIRVRRDKARKKTRFRCSEIEVRALGREGLGLWILPGPREPECKVEMVLGMGAIARHNKAFPDKAVHQGDGIIRVDGVAGSSTAICEALTTAALAITQVTIRFRHEETLEARAARLQRLEARRASVAGLVSPLASLPRRSTMVAAERPYFHSWPRRGPKPPRFQPTSPDCPDIIYVSGSGLARTDTPYDRAFGDENGWPIYQSRSGRHLTDVNKDRSHQLYFSRPLDAWILGSSLGSAKGAQLVRSPPRRPGEEPVKCPHRVQPGTWQEYDFSTPGGAWQTNRDIKISDEAPQA